MARAYYCLVAGFPDFALDEAKLPLTTASLRADLEEQLAPEDRAYLAMLFWPVDCRNLLSVLTGKPEHDASGNFARDVLEEEVRTPVLLPLYMREFLDLYRAGLSAGVHPENVLADLMYREKAGCSNAFIRGWSAFDRDLRNIVAALGCRRTGAEPEREIVGEGLVAEAVRRASGSDFGLARELVWLEPLIRSWGQTLLDRELAIDRIKMDVLDELTVSSGFSIDKVLAFVLRLGIAERWLALDAATGREMLRRILTDMESGLVFPEEFSIRGGSKHGDNR
ncbi:MAG TPA: DUF2764 family protein [Spirochaetota bacterium]|nr:DUF2764 family protein [Spirochaetota bacterium]HPH02104.1 DUF2764 family protein [Spirochaetota bacterium]